MSLDTDRVLDDPETGVEEPSLRDELSAAFAEASDDAGAAPSALAATAESRARDEQGRFAPRADGQAQSTEPRTPQAPAAPANAQAAPAEAVQTSGPPPSWSAAAKAEFDKLSPVLKQEVLKREADIERGRAQWQQGAERLNRLDAVLAPHRERIAASGASDDQVIASYFEAERQLRTDPVNAIASLARSYGVDLRVFGNGQAQQPQQAQLSPELQRIAQQVDALTNAQVQQQRQAQESERNQVMTHIQSFASDPANLYFDNVAEKMAALLKSGQAKDLPDAYQQATWADPQIRPLLLQQQAGAQATQTAEAARAKAAQARRASGSVTGSPAPGASPARGGQNPNASVRDDLMAAFSEHA